MRVTPFWVWGVPLLSLSFGAMAATDWDQLQSAQGRTQAPIVQTLLSTGDQGWWMLAESDNLYRPRTLARFEYGSSFPQSVKYIQPNLRISSIKAARNGGVYLVDSSPPDCFGNWTASYSTIQSRDITGKLTWQRTLR